MLYLTCNVVKGSKPLTFEWFKDGHQIWYHHPNEHHKVSLSSSSTQAASPTDIRHIIESRNSISHLTIPDIVVDDAGNYSCVSTNRFGFDTQWTTLEVKGLHI